MADRALVPTPPLAAGEIRALQVYEVVPSGCIGMLVINDKFSPHLRPGEIAIVDTTDKERQPGELYVLYMGIRAPKKVIVQLLRRGFGGDTSGVWYCFGFRRTINLDGGRTGRVIDGPLNPEYWPEKCVGRVIGVMSCFERDVEQAAGML